MKQISINFNSRTRITDAAGLQLYWGTATAGMAGAEPAMRQAKASLSAPAAARGLRVQEGQRYLLDAGAASRATLTAQRQKLSGTARQICACNNDKQAIASLGHEPTAALQAQLTPVSKPSMNSIPG